MELGRVDFHLHQLGFEPGVELEISPAGKRIQSLQMLSGGTTPRESMPEIVQNIMLVAPTTHFVELSQAILYRGAGLETVWQPFLALALIGAVLFFLSLARFRKTIGQMA